MAPRQGIEPRPGLLESLMLPEHLRDINNRIDFTFQVTSLKYFIAVTILKMVLTQGNDPWSLGYQPSALPLSYVRLFNWPVLRDSNPHHQFRRLV